MAKYRITRPAFIRGEYFEASIQRPSDIELPDDTPPGRTFEPLDKAAQAALLKLGVKKEVLKVATAPAPATKPAEGAEPPKRPSDLKPQ